jgi:hypothetical protein
MEEMAGFNSASVELPQTDFVVHDEVQIGGKPTHVITVLPGIRDSGLWATKLQYEARKKGLNVLILPAHSSDVGKFDFLLRRNFTEIEKLTLKELENIRFLYPKATHSIFAHSNGTKILSTIIGQLSFQYKNIILCGAVCKRREGPVASSETRIVVNDCSPIDIWPVIAQTINPFSYEATGTFGFRRSGIEDRFFSIRHGRYTDEKHFNEFVLPLILSNNLIFPFRIMGEAPRSRIPYRLPKYIRRTFIMMALLIIFAIIVYM